MAANVRPRNLANRERSSSRPLSGDRREKRHTCSMGVFRLNGKHLSKESNWNNNSMLLRSPSAESWVDAASPSEKRCDILRPTVFGNYPDGKSDHSSIGAISPMARQSRVNLPSTSSRSHPTSPTKLMNVSPHQLNGKRLAKKQACNMKCADPIEKTGKNYCDDDGRFAYLLKHANVKRVEGNKIVFVELADLPGVLIAHRSPEELERSGEKLNLDKRRLTQCPLLEGEERLRLLNFQNNNITKIENLTSLNNLIFLDLYANEITKIENLCHLPSLRVLMLGKNQVSVIENLEANARLDVLDLHSNRIEVVQNVSSLSNLRMLNLTGNMIREIDFVNSLPSSLAEINLRRNYISRVDRLDTLPNLQRLFLSQNQLATYADIEGILECTTLQELSLDGNPIAHEPNHHLQIIGRCKSRLRQLDLRCVAEERPASSGSMLPSPHGAPLLSQGILGPSSPVRNDTGVHKSSQKELEEDEKPALINFSTDERPGSVSTCSSSRHFRRKEKERDREEEQDKDSRVSSKAIPKHGEEDSAPLSPSREKLSASGRRKKESAPLRQDVMNEIRSQWQQAIKEKRVPVTRYGYVKREESFELFIFGRGLDALEKPEYQSTVSSIHFLFLTVELILQRSDILTKFENLTTLTFGHNLIYSMTQIQPILQLCELRSLQIVANPICSDTTLRMRLVQSYPGLTCINSMDVTKEERRWIRGVLAPLDEATMCAAPWTAAVPDTSDSTVEELICHAQLVEKKVITVRDNFDSCLKDLLGQVWDNDVLIE